ncbi:AraC family transcriptional regulator [Paenibacillus filicis]|uniref:AraC family transcriptional regulator n=1 Tax=Paenibacillus gyeongsangnamensis TaxID=3388067 RepID=A0ABT4QCH2_9BACL|nr:AraC family transcriptional regulator [Paenibacillus filicis]MCZ8514587.1 AraC family transcriptional regulator [Paenibacillus filicis]
MNKNIFRVITEMDRRLPVYLTSAGGWLNQEPMDRETGFPDYQWIQTLDGAGRLEAGGREYTMARGQGMLLYPDERHRYYPVQEPWTVRWVAFNGTHVREWLRSMQLEGSSSLYLANPDTVLNKMHALQSLLDSKDPAGAVECSSLLYQLLLDLFLYASRAEVRSKQQHYEQLAPVFSYIASHYAGPVSLQDLAGQLQVTPQHTCLLFQQTVGMRPIAYLTRYRLRKAKELLLEDAELEVRDIARRVGYEDSSYFIKLFKQQEGLTPSSFRKIHRLR